ncbi:MAG: M64 family metallo-endopeptidase, partial [Bacteroidales bacterium]|nr:M64 family metallo-endopeptidase [Bacteroidales bacterium]
LKQIKKEPFWGGNKNNLIEEFNYGNYKLEVFDTNGNEIYSRGFCSLFEEWQTTDEAKKNNKSFYQTVTFPYPKHKVNIKISSRKWNGEFENIFNTTIDPQDYFINPELRLKFNYKKLVNNGSTEKKVDLAILAEGYTKTEMKKFEMDATKMVEFLFEQAPFDKMKNYFNIWLVYSESEESGTDIPGERVYKKTIMNSNFYTFDSERYLTSEDVQSVRDIAANVPYDQICIIVNTPKYGGGGIYNHYSIFSADHAISDKVFVHEFGHAFAGLGDEYYNSSTSYNDYYNLEIEPWQPNITTLTNFGNKWNDMINDTIPVPTPRIRKYKNTIGVFEGGGYMAKGIFSPAMDCRMKTNRAKSFCSVCQKAIADMIIFLSE